MASKGSLRGHNPIKHGRLSHHPLVAWFSERRRLLWATLRAGHAGTANGAQEFLVPAFTLLPAGYRIGLVRADAGVVVTAFRRVLETRDLPYLIVARLTPLVRKRVIHRISEADWRPVMRGHRGRRREGDVPRLAGAGTPVCGPASDADGAAHRQRAWVIEWPGVKGHLSSLRHDRALCGRIGDP